MADSKTVQKIRWRWRIEGDERPTQAAN